ncbi:MAG: AbrB/MazE/SpoVT family DNA-binding domain-containing protein [Clostridium sp.]|uniref:AbrB/MazE/SpoVT family DNA-binding domain-containing protein n=1 Tax=Clostridium sp. TaxID=1506 RepID=UPI002910DB96|nr:AbrB/MazE/SpoVT family DNA-binding domain-containing protein [Clostridium sp.]MDU7337262.1 AbrB/MazE/SpoVT family DNA-binding domain-containing protein [Clostridium sp.]
MKHVTGVVRNIDLAGRIVIPKELRRTLGWEVGDPIEIIGQENGLVIKAYHPDPLIITNEELRRRLNEINRLTHIYEARQLFNVHEAFSRIRQITNLDEKEGK